MHPLWIEYLFCITSVFVLGCVIGSWLNVCVYRLPREERFWTALKNLSCPPSHCPRCQTPIKWYDNVPVLGWLRLRGRCRNCRGKIPARYPLVEFTTGCLFALLYWCEVPMEWTASGGTLAHPYGPATLFSPALTVVHVRFGLHVVLLSALIVATLIDIDLRIIPDSVTLPAMTTAVAVQFLSGITYLVPVWYQTREMGDSLRSLTLPFHGSRSVESWLINVSRFEGPVPWLGDHPHLHGLAVSLAGLLLGGAVIWGVRLAGVWALRMEAMGFGDVVLMAMIGSFIGWQGTLAVFVLAPLLAVLGALATASFRLGDYIPFGPYLSLATLLVLVGFRRFWPALETSLLGVGPLLPLVALIMLVSLVAMLSGWWAIKRRLGWVDLAEQPQWVEQWLPADQLTYQAMENADPRQGQWRTPAGEAWPGQLAGRGLGHYEAWRHPSGPSLR
jgi:leader peptidase (prepilin peptidase)/N-methyltransferase